MARQNNTSSLTSLVRSDESSILLGAFNASNIPSFSWTLNTGARDNTAHLNHKFINYVRSDGRRKVITASRGALHVEESGRQKLIVGVFLRMFCKCHC